MFRNPDHLALLNSMGETRSNSCPASSPSVYPSIHHTSHVFILICPNTQSNSICTKCPQRIPYPQYPFSMSLSRILNSRAQAPGGNGSPVLVGNGNGPPVPVREGSPVPVGIGTPLGGVIVNGRLCLPSAWRSMEKPPVGKGLPAPVPVG